VRSDSKLKKYAIHLAVKYEPQELSREVISTKKLERSNRFEILELIHSLNLTSNYIKL